LQTLPRRYSITSSGAQYHRWRHSKGGRFGRLSV
jgi:hypothetical protein